MKNRKNKQKQKKNDVWSLREEMMDGVEKKNLGIFLSSRRRQPSKLQAALPFLEVLEVVVGSTQPKKLL